MFAISTIRDDLLIANLKVGPIQKHHSTSDLVTVIGTIISFRIAGMICIPGEIREQVEQTIEYCLKLRPAFATANVFTPYPKLELTQYAIARGHLNPSRFTIPRNFFDGSVLNFDRHYNVFLTKSFCLLPSFVWFPALWHRRWCRRILYRIPQIVLRPIYELTYLTACKMIYCLRTLLRVALAMAARYVRSL